MIYFEISTENENLTTFERLLQTIRTVPLIKGFSLNRKLTICSENIGERSSKRIFDSLMGPVGVLIDAYIIFFQGNL